MSPGLEGGGEQGRRDGAFGDLAGRPRPPGRFGGDEPHQGGEPDPAPRPHGRGVVAGGQHPLQHEWAELEPGGHPGPVSGVVLLPGGVGPGGPLGVGGGAVAEGGAEHLLGVGHLPPLGHVGVGPLAEAGEPESGRLLGETAVPVHILVPRGGPVGADLDPPASRDQAGLSVEVEALHAAASRVAAHVVGAQESGGGRRHQSLSGLSHLGHRVSSVVVIHGAGWSARSVARGGLEPPAGGMNPGHHLIRA